MSLLTRDSFRSLVFERDRNRCIICGEPAVDAHHIMERRLFIEPHEFGGYFLDNGASVCELDHRRAESTELSTNEIREKAGIKKVILPSHLYDDQHYDKWGNIILENSRRIRGELFDDPSVQKVLQPLLHLFTHHVKYPRTYHLPWSLGLHEDDRMHFSSAQWNGVPVVITLKMDGENTTMYNDYIHARSLDSRNHPSRNWVKNFWSQIAHNIPSKWRVCGENLYARHSIGYDDLPSFFLGFSIWDDQNRCLSWEDTLEFFYLIGIVPVRTLYDGIYDENIISSLHQRLDLDKDEGYVLRPKSSFYYRDFNKYVGKFVRNDHIKTTKHWMQGQELIKNGTTRSGLG